MKKRILSILASALFSLGVITFTPASIWLFVYQPKAPKCLQK